MGKRDVLSIALKVLGIYFILYTLPTWAQIVVYIFDLTPEARVIWSAMGMAQLCVVLVSFGLIFWSDRLAGVLCKASSGTETGLLADRHGIRDVAFCVLGLYFMVHSIPMIGSIVASRWWFDVPGVRMTPWWRSLIGPCIQLVVGLWLFLGSRPIAAWVRRVHDAGHTPSTGE